MENLTLTEGHEESATSLNLGKNGGKMSRAIKCLRFDMRRQQPVNKIRRQLKEIQTDYDEVVRLLTELYRYTDEAPSAVLKEWESTLREDLLSVECDVRAYDQEEQISTDGQTDTGRLTRSVAESCEIEQLSSTVNDDVSPPPESLDFNRLLLKISKGILDGELKTMKLLFRGPGVIGKRDLEDISHPIDFFLQLQKSGHLTPNSIVVLQAVLWNTANIELFNEVTQFAEKMGDMVYASVPSSEPANGYKYVKLHHEQKPLRETVDVVRQRIATWFGTPLQFVSVVGSEEASSWYITLMIPEICTEKLQRSVELNRKWFSEQGIDSVELDGRTIDVTEEQATDPVSCTGDMGDITMQHSSTTTDVMSPPPEDLDFNRGPLKVFDDIEDLELKRTKLLSEEQIPRTTHDDTPAPPEDMAFNRLLFEISERVLNSELNKMKFLLQGPGMTGKWNLEDISDPIEFFYKLRNSGYLTPNNIVVLQAMLWNTGHIELFKEVTQFAEKMEDVLYVSVPSSEPAVGYQYVKLHMKGTLLKEAVEDVRQRIAAWFGIPMHFVLVAELKPAN